MNLSFKLAWTLIAASLGFAAGASQISENRANIVSRCFFVYAPLYEAASQTGNERLRSYSLQRLMYVRGILDAGKNDPLLAKSFERNLAENKRRGIQIERRTIEAYRAGDVQQYNSQVAKAETCDKELGL